ncbi:MAG: hypothetical protein CM1200mP30_34050 [Pseudomonadota bacterium]|nr:MAG: hypothetical protein CM1200mP30_34050 [Pseudomonadota bacterium]
MEKIKTKRLFPLSFVKIRLIAITALQFFSQDMPFVLIKKIELKKIILGAHYIQIFKVFLYVSNE